jgi:TatD DNase family protein
MSGGPGVFISHSWEDQAVARRLAADLSHYGARVWIDEAEILVGDSLIEKIRQGIDDMDYVAALISKASVSSRWVAKELDIAMNQEIDGKRVKVLPLLLEDCELPGFLKGKAFADLRTPERYDAALVAILRRLGIRPPHGARPLKEIMEASRRPMLIDTHCHIGPEDRQLAPTDELMARAKLVNVRVVVINPDRADAKHCVALARSRNDMVVVLGGHPIHRTTEEDHLHYDRSEPLLAEDIVVGIETGLDFYIDQDHHADQEATFAHFITLARVLRKPLVIQLRDSGDRALEIMEREHASDVGGVVHCFSESREFARSVLDQGFDVCFTGSLTFPKADSIRAVAAWLPLDRILVESMSPFLAPVPYRGKMCEPAHVVEVVKVIADVRGASYDAIASATTLNAVRRFGAPLERLVRGALFDGSPSQIHL